MRTSWQLRPIWGGITRMVEATFAKLEEAKLRWMSGGVVDATGNAFASGDTSPEAQLRLLALAGVFRHTCLRPQEPGNLKQMPLLPEPALPLLSEVMRPAFRQMMQQQDRSVWQGLIGLMAARGYMAHPFDWLPPQDLTGYPEAYIPLAKWKAGMGDAQPTLTAETWDDMYPAERRGAFAALRKSDPAAARALMEEQGGNLPAEERLMLVATFSDGLGVDDQSYLEKLAGSDRSAKVKAKAVGYLARLGVVTDDADARELANFIETSTSGLLRRRKAIGLRKKLNETQKKRAYSLFETVTLPQLATALSMSSDEVAASYVTEPRPIMAPFFDMCVRSAPTATLMIYWERLRTDGVAQFSMLADLADRLDRDQTLAEVKRLIDTGRLTDLRDMLLVTGADVGPTISDALLKAGYYKKKLSEVEAALANRAKGDGDYQSTHLINQFEAFITILAFLVTANHARAILADLEDVGFHAADPLFRPLKFNIDLEGSSP